MKKLFYSMLILAFLLCSFVVFAQASTNKILVSNYESEQVELSVIDDYLIISNLPENDQFEYLTAVFYKGSGYKSEKSASNSETHKVKFKIPYYSDDNYEVAVYYGNDILTPFLPYTITININGGTAKFVESPTLNANLDKFNSSPMSKNDMEYYSFYYLSKNDGDEQVRNVVKSLTDGIENNYEKAFLIYEWMTSNFYYNESLKDDSTLPSSTVKELLIDKICDSRDFATLYSYLLRAAGIPTRTVYGIGLINNKDAVQSTTHHYWNEVYIDNNWIIVDVAMSCSNRYIDGVKYRYPKTNNIYFDSTLEFFSYSHSIISYESPAYYEGYKDILISPKPNGTKKTLADLGIPSYVTVKTSIGELELNVEWDMADISYDPGVTSEQVFTVDGTVTLPSAFAACNSLKQKISVEVKVNARYPISVVIESLPEKLIYFKGEDLDTNGLVLSATFDNGDVEPIRRTYTAECDLSKIGKTLVTVSYKDVSTTFEVDVVSKKPNELKLEQEPDKMIYFVGEIFDKTGIKLKAICDMDMTYYVEDYEINYDFSESGNRNVVLTYEGISVIINVRVEDILPIKLELDNLPSKMDYLKNSTPDFSGITAKILYNDGTERIVSDALSFDFDLSIIGKTSVKVSYGGVFSSFEINVIEPINENSALENSTSIEESELISDNSDSVDNVNNKKSYIVEIIGISIVSILLVVLSFFALKRANEISKISDWIKDKK